MISSIIHQILSKYFLRWWFIKYEAIYGTYSPQFFLWHWRRIACTEFFSWFQCTQTVFKINTITYRNISYLLMNCIAWNESWNVQIVYITSGIYNQKSEHIDFKGLAEVISKLIFNNLHNPSPTKYFDIIINPLYSKQLLNLVLVEDCGGI
jgi:hypothetical protein